MAWGNILTQVATHANPALGAGVSFLNNLFQSNSQEKKAKKAENAYYAALAQQRQLAELSAQTAAQRASFEKAMKDRILTQTGEMGSTLRAAQRNMGAMPQYNQDTVNQDYAKTKAAMMQDFNDMLTLVESQGRSAQMERLGGAGSTAADNDRMNALMKRFTPELQKIDDAAYDSAVNRSMNVMNLINTNRQNTLNELVGVITPQMNAEMNLLGQGALIDMSNPMNQHGYYMNNVGLLATSKNKVANDQAPKTEASLGTLLAQVFNRPQTEQITWNGPRWTGETSY